MEVLEKKSNPLSFSVEKINHFFPNMISENNSVLLNAFIEESLQGRLRWDKNVIRSINLAIDHIDGKISEQLSKVMHDENFKNLEGAWRGLHYLTFHTSTNNNLKIKTLSLSKKEIYKDLTRASDFDQSQLFKMIYEREFGTPGGEPYGVLLGDYEFSHVSEDIELLSKLSNISAASFCPFISSASASLFGFDSWRLLSKPKDLEKIFDSKEYIKWNALRKSEDARFLVLTLPSVLARLPYGVDSKKIDAFNFEEFSVHDDASQTENYCWMNAAYAMGERIANAFSNYQWCTAIRGAEGGGKVKNLPVHTFISKEGDQSMICPTEVSITDRREAELSRLGFLPLCHYKNTDFSVFFGGQTLQKPLRYDKPEANSNAIISARLPYVMATSRFAHYLKIIARDKIGSFMDAQEVENLLNRWIANYVNANANSGQEMKAKYPLAEAKVHVESIPGKPSAFHAIAWLKPWLQLEELTTSLRLVATIPKDSL